MAAPPFRKQIRCQTPPARTATATMPRKNAGKVGGRRRVSRSGHVAPERRAGPSCRPAATPRPSRLKIGMRQERNDEGERIRSRGYTSAVPVVTDASPPESPGQ